MANPLGISTGQGKGLAQVFGDTYNDYYKEKADEGAKKKAELEAAMAKSSAGVWDRDLGLFKPMREDLRKYVQDNARDIIDGKFDANVGWQKKQDELLQFINSSKAAKTFYEKNAALFNANPDKYSELSKQDLDDYARTAGRFDSNIFLEGKFDAQKSIDAMTDDLAKVQYKVDSVGAKVYGIDGKEFLVETSSQRKEAAKNILDARIARDKDMYRRQAENYWNKPDNYNNQLKMLENALGSKVETKQFYESKDSTGLKPEKEKLEILRDVEEYTVIPFAFEKDGKLSTTVQGNQKINKDFKVSFKSGVFKGRPSTSAIPIGGAYAYSQYETDPSDPTGKRQKLKEGTYAAIPGKEFDIPRVRKSLPSGDWSIQDISVLNAFSSDSKGAKTGDLIAGYPIPKDYKLQSGQKSEKRAYATLENSDGQKVLVPVKDIEGSIKESYKEQWYTKKQELLNMINQAGGNYLNALKDFSGSSSSSGKKPLPSPAELGIKK